MAGGRIRFGLALALPLALLLPPAAGLVAGLLPSANPGMASDACSRSPASIWESLGVSLRKFSGTAPEQPDWAQLCHYARDNARLLQSGEPVRAVFIGDSVTQNWAVGRPGLFTGGIVNRGIGGQTSGQVLLRFSADALALKPQAIHLMVGLNDATGLNGPTRPEEFQANLRAMLLLAKAQGVRVVVGAIPPASRVHWAPHLAPAPRVRALNAWLAQLAREQGAAFVDYYTPLAAADGGLKAEYALDPAHPNARAYAVMEQQLREPLAAALAAPITR